MNKLEKQYRDYLLEEERKAQRILKELIEENPDVWGCIDWNLDSVIKGYTNQGMTVARVPGGPYFLKKEIINGTSALKIVMKKNPDVVLIAHGRCGDRWLDGQRTDLAQNQAFQFLRETFNSYNGSNTAQLIMGTEKGSAPNMKRFGLGDLITVGMAALTERKR